MTFIINQDKTLFWVSYQYIFTVFAFNGNQILRKLKTKQTSEVHMTQTSLGNDRMGRLYKTTQGENNSLRTGVIPAGDGSLIYLPALWTSHRKLNT
jgi:hypothetical protein